MALLESYFEAHGKLDFVIAADSGLERAVQYGFSPDMVIGDMDSLADKTILSKIREDKIQSFPCDKDYSDTELALAKAFDTKIDIAPDAWITLFGGGGGRIDHLFGIFDIFSGDRPMDAWIPGNRSDEDETQALYFLRSGRTLEIEGLFHSDYISVCRTGKSFEGGYIESSGLQWSEFRKKGMPSLSNRIANDNESGKVVMTAHENDFVIIVPIQAKCYRK